jgi:outer membrane protein assembly factor BamB
MVFEAFRRLRSCRLVLMALAVVAAGPAKSIGEEAASPGVLQASGIRGGLLAVVGARPDAVAMAIAAVRSGPFLAQVLDPDPAAVQRAQQTIARQRLYGLVSVDRLDRRGKLPYTEDLVNLLVIEDQAGGRVPLEEAPRVLCPHGVVCLPADAAAETGLKAAGFEDIRQVSLDRDWLVARKPRPAAMDEWTHPRYGADGNAVSHDQLVGPPRRIRWIAGPQQEISNMVSSDGRNFYAGVIARDGFNGLRLWQREMAPSPARGGFNFRSAAGSVRSVARGGLLFGVAGKQVVAMDGATGKTVREYPEAGTPLEILCADDVLVAVDAESVRAVALSDGKLHWKHEAKEPRYVVAGQRSVYLLQGRPRLGEKCVAVALDLAKGTIRWQHDEWDWLAGVRAIVCHGGLVAYETSSLKDDKPGNLIHLVSASDGKVLWDRTFVPGMAHWKQARAMFAGQSLWILDDRKCSSLDLQSGEIEKTYPAGSGHCFPPVATEQFLFAGEMNLTSLDTGTVDANRITKGACGRDAGFVLANGLIYAFPKHCVCWPMLRDYAALATARPGGDPLPGQPLPEQFALEKGPAEPPTDAPVRESAAEWPCYRHDAWRSGSTPGQVPAALKTLWKTDLGNWPQSTIAADWRVNPFCLGPVTPPVAAAGLVYVARPDSHQVVALDAQTGTPRWAFTSNGRVDTPPTIRGGLCLFGTRSGWVYCLRADDGRLVWRLRAAPLEERIAAYGQIESPWPIPGSVLVVDGVAFFAAGRQPLADGGILVFAVEPPTGRIVWVKKLDSVPQKEFYAASSLEFEGFDLLHREGEAVAMSRWLFDRRSGQMRCEATSGFAHLVTGGGGVMAPRGLWSYGPRYESEQIQQRPFLQPLVVFRDDTLLGCSEDRLSVYRRDFNQPGGEKFDGEWFNKWTVQKEAQKGGDLWRSQRLARGAAWSVPTSKWLDGKQQVAAMVLSKDALFLAGANGGLAAVSPQDGKLIARSELAAPVWDGLASAGERLYATTRDGQVVCLGR